MPIFMPEPLQLDLFEEIQNICDDISYGGLDDGAVMADIDPIDHSILRAPSRPFVVMTPHQPLSSQGPLNFPHDSLASLMLQRSYSYRPAVVSPVKRRFEEPITMTPSCQSNKKACTANTSPTIATPTPTVPKKSPVQGGTPLHKACCNPDVKVEEVQDLMREHPDGSITPGIIPTIKNVYCPRTMKMEPKHTMETYQYPINLAIQKGASAKVIEALFEGAPEVLVMQDGPMKECPLSVLIKHRPQEADLMSKMLLANPDCVRVRDRHDNTSTHIACMFAANLTIIRRLSIMHPEALHMKNFHGKAPIQIAQSKSTSDEDAVSFLLEKLYACKELIE